MAEFTQYNLEPVQDSGIPTQPTAVSGVASTPYTSTNDSSNMASRVETLEKYVEDIKANYARKGGDVNFLNAYITEKLTAKFGNIAGWDVDKGVMSTNKLTIDSNNQWIRSNNYQTGVSGFTLQDNLVEAENAIIRGTIRGGTFAYDKINAVGGQLMVSNADTLALDMGALDADTMTTKGDTTFAVNDILVMRNTVGGAVVEEWFRVTAVNGNTYTVTRDLAGLFSANDNPKWKSGTPVVKQGSSNGSTSYSGGWLRLIGEGTNAPYYSVFARTGVAYNAYTEVGRLGNLNGIGSISSDAYGIFMGNGSTGNYLQYDNASGEMILNDTSLKFTAFFGDGSDGDVTISADTTLTSDMYYNNLTVNNTKVLNTGGYRIFVKGTLTNNGTIHRNGNNGGNGQNATGTTTQANGGTAGSALASGTLYGGLAGKVGGIGDFGGGNAGVDGDNQTESYASSGVAGGHGADSAYSAQAGGSAGTNTLTTAIPRNAVFAIPMTNLSSATTIKTSSGSGSGAGGAQGGASYGAGGGGSGSSGGIVLICAKKIVNNGTISAKGGNGGNGGNGIALGGGAGGGGGAGSGGILCLIYNSFPTTGTISVAGGTGGLLGTNQTTNGSNGSDGNAGKIIYLPI